MIESNVTLGSNKPLLEDLKAIRSALEKQLFYLESTCIFNALKYLGGRHKTLNKRNTLVLNDTENLEHKISYLERLLKNKEYHTFTPSSLETLVGSLENLKEFGIDIEALEDIRHPDYESSLTKLVISLKEMAHEMKVSNNSSSLSSDSVNRAIDLESINGIFNHSSKIQEANLLKAKINKVDDILRVIESTGSTPNNIFRLEGIINDTSIKVVNLVDNSTKIHYINNPIFNIKIVLNKYVVMFNNYQTRNGLLNLIGLNPEEIFLKIDSILDSFITVKSDPSTFNNKSNYRVTDEYFTFRRARVNSLLNKNIFNLEFAVKDETFAVKPHFDIEESVINYPLFEIKSNIDKTEDIIYSVYQESDYDISYLTFYNRYRTTSSFMNIIEAFNPNLKTGKATQADSIDYTINPNAYSEAYIKRITINEGSALPYRVYTNSDIKRIISDKLLYESLSFKHDVDEIESFYNEIVDNVEYQPLVNILKNKEITSVNVNNGIVDKYTLNNDLKITHTEFYNTSVSSYAYLGGQKITIPMKTNKPDMSLKADLKTKSRMTLLQLLSIYINKYEQEIGTPLPISPVTLNLVYDRYKGELLKTYFDSYKHIMDDVIQNVIKSVNAFISEKVGYRVINDILRKGVIDENEYGESDAPTLEISITDLEELNNFFILKNKLYNRTCKVSDAGMFKNNLQNLELFVYKDYIYLDDLFGYSTTRYKNINSINLKLKAFTYPEEVKYLYKVSNMFNTLNIETDISNKEANNMIYTETTSEEGIGKEAVKVIDTDRWLSIGFKSEREIGEYVKYINIATGYSKNTTTIRKEVKINPRLLAFTYASAIHEVYGDRQDYRNILFDNLVLPSITDNIYKVRQLIDLEDFYNYLKSKTLVEISKSPQLDEIGDYAVFYSNIYEIDLSHLIANLNTGTSLNTALELEYLGYNRQDFDENVLINVNDYLTQNNLADITRDLDRFDVIRYKFIKTSFIRDVKILYPTISKSTVSIKLNMLNKIEFSLNEENTIEDNKVNIDKYINEIKDAFVKTLVKENTIDNKLEQLVQEEELKGETSDFIESDLKLFKTLCSNAYDSISKYFKTNIERNIIISFLYSSYINSEKLISSVTLKPNEALKLLYKDYKLITDDVKKFSKTRLMFNILHKVCNTPESIRRYDQINNNLQHINREISVMKIDKPWDLRTTNLFKLFMDTGNDEILKNIDYNKVDIDILTSFKLGGSNTLVSSPFSTNSYLERFDIMTAELSELQMILSTVYDISLEPIEFLSVLFECIYLNPKDTEKHIQVLRDLMREDQVKTMLKLISNLQVDSSVYNSFQTYVDIQNYNGGFDINGFINLIDLLEKNKVEPLKIISELPRSIRNEFYNYFSSLDNSILKEGKVGSFNLDDLDKIQE